MARPENSTVDIKKIIQGRMGRLRVWCQHEAAEMEQWAMDNASITSSKYKGGGPASNKPSNKMKAEPEPPKTPPKPIQMTARMKAESEKTKTLKDRVSPWTDMTRDARKQLKGVVIDDGDALGIGIVHRVEYGKALELAFDGKYAILRPALEHFRADFLDKARKIMNGEEV